MTDNFQFYPTPDDVIRRMLTVKEHDGDEYLVINYPVLDPSAGNGAILDMVSSLTQHYRKSTQLYAVELDIDRQFTLKGKGYRLIGSDFLEFNEPIKFPTILMNPPFRNGVQHLMKAWALLEDGGVLKCLLNKQTVENAYSEPRSLLKQLIEKYGETEDFGNCFSNADRQTDVEVVCITLNKPKAASNKSSFNFGDTSFTEEHFNVLSQDESAGVIGISSPIKNLVAQYNGAVKALIDRDKMQKQLDICLNGISRAINASGIADDSDVADIKPTLNEQLANIKSRFWATMFDKTELSNRCTSDFRKKFDDFQLQQCHMAFTEENILQVVLMFFTNHETIMQDAVVSFFDNATKYHRDNEVGCGYKTNLPHKLNTKIIMPGCVEFEYSKWKVPYGRGYSSNSYVGVFAFFDDLDKVFNYLSGETENTSSMHSIETAFTCINNGDVSYQTKFEARWFDFRFYKNGNIHLFFKDKKVLDDLNKLVGSKRKWLGDPKSVSFFYYQRDKSSWGDEVYYIVRDIVKSFEGATFSRFKEYDDVKYAGYRIEVYCANGSIRGKIAARLNDILEPYQKEKSLATV